MDTPDASEEFRPFDAPAALVLEAPVRSGKIESKGSCKLVSDRDFAHEGSRHVAAVDAHLRSQGGMLLPSVPGFYFPQSQPSEPTQPKLGDIFRGPKGERLMHVGSRNQCHKTPLIALSMDKEVFILWPEMVAKKSRRIRACMGPCGGCGMQMLDTMLVAEVPEGAQLVAPRTVRVPIEQSVVFDGKRPCPPRP